jgi:hypothetical protein
VGVLAGVSVGGVGVIAASSTKTVTVCANKKTNVLRYAKNGKCVAKSETKVLLNQTGSDGTTGVAGAKGDPGATGPKGDAGAAGASSPTGFTARSVCGANGTTLCTVGVRGPGGGVIVYVDTTNEMPGYDYLEVAPTDASSIAAWSTNIVKCGTVLSGKCDEVFLSDAATALGYIGLGTGRAATAAIVAHHDAGGVAKNLYAAGFADDYTTETASDWFLPSRDELNEVCKYARQTGQAAGAATVCAEGTLRNDFTSNSYWSSSESLAGAAWLQRFYDDFPGDGAQDASDKPGRLYVRPVRAF